MNLLQAFVGNVGVNLRRGDRGMPEHGLDAADVGAVYEKIRSEAVAERVRMYVLHDAGLLSVELDEALDAPRSEPEGVSILIFAVDEAFFRRTDEEGRIYVDPFCEIGFERAFGIGREENDAQLAALAAHAEFFLVQINVLAV